MAEPPEKRNDEPEPGRQGRFTLLETGGGPDRGKVNPPGTGTLGMWILLASLAMLFLTSMAGYLYIRFSQPSWPPPGMPHLPSGLWISTVVLISCSVTGHLALVAIRRDDARGLARMLTVTLVLGALFLILQTVNYLILARENLTAATNLYGFTFYMLTGLHALHVIGGLIPLVVTLRRARVGRYTSFFHQGVRHVVLYWHFLDAVWIVVFACLLLGS
ncbi:MAG: heme-copper oxidase subunit III [Candidatus Eisenbacteria bacterium]|uniref:Heme-copper oxidase subunit III n=1 Tax=Eiseniibacteriota bacterium TaxID=2212470 RepID=A0A956RR22_UNCEI|nr:heme-copper oxidase subunit III [Candidatus Eisenbacteria bacterium]